MELAGSEGRVYGLKVAERILTFSNVKSALKVSDEQPASTAEQKKAGHRRRPSGAGSLQRLNEMLKGL